MKKNTLLIIIICGFVWPHLGTGQERMDSSKLKIAEDFFNQANTIYNKDVNRAIALLDSALIYYKTAGAWEKYVGMLNTLASVHFYENHFEKYRKFAAQAINEAEDKLPPNHLIYSDALNNLNSYYENLGDYDQSIALLEKSIGILNQSNANGLDLANAYNNIGTVIAEKGDYPKALEYLFKGLELRTDTVSKNPLPFIQYLVATTKINIAWTYVRAEQLDAALEFYTIALKELNRIKDYNLSLINRNKITALQNIAYIHYLKEAFEKGFATIEQVFQYQKDDRSFRKPYSYELMGDLLFAKKEYKKSFSYYDKALSLTEKFYSTTILTDYSRIFKRIAIAKEQLNKHEEALYYYQKALLVLAPGFTEENPEKNPSPSLLYSKLDALDILLGKGNVFWSIYKTEQKDSALLSAANSFIDGVNLIKEFRQGVLTEETKNTLSEKTIPVYEGAIRTTLEQYRLFDENALLQKAFLLAESNKSLLLLESINEQAALGLKGMPDSLIQFDKTLRLNMAFYQKKIIEALNKKEDPSKIKQWKNQVFEIKEDLRNLTRHFEKNYPRFYQLKYQEESLDLNHLQGELSAGNQALIEYFAGEENWYAFVVWGDGLEVFTINNNGGIVNQIKTLKNAITQIPEDDQVVQNYTDFTTSAYRLYQNILEPALIKLPDPIRVLKIIPDYHLNYIPFDLLLMEKAEKGSPYFSINNLGYVLEKYQVSYDYSATFMLKNQKEKQRDYKNDFIAYAPSFQKAVTANRSRSCQADELYQLACSQEEVVRINKLLRGDIRKDDAATTSAFKEEAADYRVIHMATHACADEANPLFNKIFLTNDFLSNADLYNTELNAALLVLSACNTGSGKLVKGEGVLSLARGFVQAGCASSVVSRWSVDDCATSEIMQGFYKYLKAGKTKDEALQLAKVTYLEGSDQLHAHPYFWSAFVAYGDMKEMKLEYWVWWYYLLAGIALIGLVVLFKRMIP